ncbi:MAG: WD40 repeat domain-containing protein [Anaerolineae bacterium]|nr:WD40 repeat domain-containing protein [Anaerolineae bacterium]MCI0610909.1 WD40 repeat domain-containing protein [Anaerolineae bacterium]
MDDEKEKDEPQVHAEDNSIAVGGIHIEGDVSGTITIGHGYTAEQVSVLLKQITTTLQPKPFDGRCPYKGLEVFEEEDAELFFGRERLVEDLVSRVKESRTVFITGPSGSGKSSLVRAGLIHALKSGSIKGSDRWLYETMKPGREPIKDLALAFSRLKSPDLANYFLAHKSEINILNECAESVLSGRKDQHFLLFVDQFEEVFTQVSQEEERLAFLYMLAHAATVENGRVIVLFAMRSDFVSNCATYPALNELLSQEFRQIGAMQPEELVSAIALPARHVGLPIEDELIARIINDMKGEPGALPLMQFALKDLFDSQQEKGGVIALTLKDYLQHGGIHKSLERHADATFAKLSENEQQLARSIFSGLIEIGRGTQDTRRTALFDELVPVNAKAEEVSAVVQKLADARLIITDEQSGKDTATISHEKLIDAWPWLKKLVNENRDVIALQNEIASDAMEWDDRKRDPSYLYTGARLANVREQLELNKLVLSGLAQSFIEAGAKAYADELEATRQRATQLRQRSIYLTAALVGALIAVGIAVFFGIQSQQRAKVALARQLATQAQSINATRNSKQMVAVLLATQSMKLSPSNAAAQVLQNNNFAARPISSMTHDDSVYSVAFSPDGKFVVSGSWDGTARVWEAATGKEISRMTHDDRVNLVAFSPDGKYVVSGGCDKRDTNSDCAQATTRVWEAATGKEISRMTHDDRVYSIAFSPDGKYVVSGSYDTTARVWEAATGKEISRMTHDNWLTSVAFSPDGKYVVSGSIDNTALVWEASTGKEIVHMTQFLLQTVAFSSNGNYVVSGGYDGAVRVWETSTGQEVAHMTHDDVVNSVAFSPDGKYVVSGSSDNTARVWEASTGKEVAHMTQDRGLNAVAFSPDGKYVVSGGNIAARVWLWRPDDLIADACSRLPRNITRAEWKQYVGDEPYQAVCTNLPIEPELNVIPKYYYALLSISPTMLYIFYGWVASRAISSQFRSSSSSDAAIFSWKRFAMSIGQGGLLIILVTSALILTEYLFYRLRLLPSNLQLSPLILLLLIPSGLWAGGAYSHFTFYQSGRLSWIKRIVLGSVAGFMSSFLPWTVTIAIVAIVTGVDSLPNNFWQVILISSGVVGGIGAVLSAFGALLYILILQKVIGKIAAGKQALSHQ